MKQKLFNILYDLSQHHRNPADLMQVFVSERLSKSFDQYNKELQQSLSFLTSKHEKSILKRMRKLDD